MQMVAICEVYGWTRDEFLDQPVWFIDLIREKMRIDSQKQEAELNKAKKR